MNEHKITHLMTHKDGEMYSMCSCGHKVWHEFYIEKLQARIVELEKIESAFYDVLHENSVQELQDISGLSLDRCSEIHDLFYKDGE